MRKKKVKVPVDTITKTITTVESTNLFDIYNYACDTKPTIFRSIVIDRPVRIDGKAFIEGELAMNYIGDPTLEMIQSHLMLESDAGDTDQYERDDENLIYNE